MREQDNDMRTILILIVLLVRPLDGQVTVRVDSIPSAALGRTVPFTVILPDGYRKSDERYPTLYLLHGYGGDHTNWSKLTGLLRYLSGDRLIVVCPDGNNGWYTNGTDSSARNEDHLVQELIPAVDRSYRTVRAKHERSVAGLSMGGYGAVKLGVKYPSLFSFAAGLSPALQFPSDMDDSVITARWSPALRNSVRTAFGLSENRRWTENDVYPLLERMNTSEPPYFYLFVGSSDAFSEIVLHTHRFAAALRKKGIPFELHEMPGRHDWKFWDREIAAVLSILRTRHQR